MQKTLTAFFLLTALAGADVQYTSKISFPTQPGAPQMQQSMTTSLKGKRQRDETLLDMGAFKSKTVSITQCDKKQLLQVDDDLKIYTVSPIGAAPPVPAQPGQKGTGTLTTTYTVVDKGVEKIAKVDAHHWLINTDYQATGCAGNYDEKMKVEVWTAPIQVLVCPELWNVSWNQPDCKVTISNKGDVAKMQQAYNGMIVKMITYARDKVTSTREMVNYSTAALPDSLFDVGKDYKQVSQTEFASQQQQKMMKQYQH